MSNEIIKYSWVETHKEIVKYLAKNQNNQKQLIELLKKVGITGFNDKDANGKAIDLEEIDPFTFFCYIYKYGSQRRLSNLQKIADEIKILKKPTDESGIPSADARKVWLFPYKADRNNNEIPRLWSFFNSVLKDSISEEQFEDILTIQGIGKTKLTEILFYVNPEKYFPINGPTKPYLQESFKINPNFNSYSEYLDILKRIKQKSLIPFYELSYESWNWNEKKEDPFSKVLLNFNKTELSNYFSFLRDIISAFQLRKGDERLVFSIRKDRLNFTIGQRYCWNLYSSNSKEKYGVISKKKLLPNSEPFDGKLPQPFYNQYQDIKFTGDEIMSINSAIDEELKRTLISGFRKYNDLDFENAAFDQSFLNKNILINYSKMNFPLNTIFYGPPGTGKTYNTILRAAQIITNSDIKNYDEALKIFNEHLGNRIEFITFHQNYSYEDFIQGLRPDVEKDGSLSFEKKDGIFTRIATNALFEYYKIFADRKRTLKTTDQNLDTNEVYLSFYNFLKTTPNKIYKTKTGSDLVIISFTGRKCLRFSHSNSSVYHTVSGDRLIKLFEKFPSIDNIKNVHKDITDAIGGCNATVYWTALKEFIEFYKNTKKQRKNLIEEDLINYEDISFEEKKEFLNTVNFSELSSINTKEVPNYIIIIDEINRANISRVFGELITLIEPDKRSHGSIPLRCTLPSGDEFIVPSNLYIIGTMNTADKSIALLDIALRRRFEFEAMYPLYNIDKHAIYNVDILQKINKSIIGLKGHDFQIGHSYFMDDNIDLIERMNKKVIPLLLEYFMNDEKEVKGILTNAGLSIEKDSWPITINGTL